MPAPSRITPDLLAEVARRREAGEEWKRIAADLRARGLPSAKSALWTKLRDVREHMRACSDGSDECTAI